MTQQDRQFKKVKLYRTLKAVFYFLGLPTFVFAVFLSSIRFIGNDPFTGNSIWATQLGFLYDINILFTSPALYGVWIAFGIWFVVAIVHIILSKTVKSRRVRALAVTAFMLVVMLGGMFTMDAVFSAKIDNIAASAPSTVTVEDYKTQLAYYRTISSKRYLKSMSGNLIRQVERLKQAYHVGKEGEIKTGVAGSIANKPVTYYNVISDEGKTGVDIGFTTTNGISKLNVSGAENRITGGDGVITKDVEGKQVIRLAPNSKGELVINGEVYSHYFAEPRTSVTGGTIYTWYTRDMESTSWKEGDPNAQIRNLENGIYGKALYNQNGLISDGWVYSLENVIEILEDYYEAKDFIENGGLSTLESYYREKLNVDKDTAIDAYALMYAEALERREQYYKGEIPDVNGEYASKWLQALYAQEVDMTERFSLTRGEIDELVAKVGALLGDNALFSYLFNTKATGNSTIDGVIDSALSGSILGTTLKGLFDQLAEGLPLSKFITDEGTMKTVGDIIKLLTAKDNDPNYSIDDIYIMLAYKDSVDGLGVKHDNLYLAVVRGIAEWRYSDDSLVPLTKRDGKLYYEDETEFIPLEKMFDKNGKEVVEAGEWRYLDGSHVPIVKHADGKWYYEDNSEFVVKVEEERLVDESGKEIARVKYTDKDGKEINYISLGRLTYAQSGEVIDVNKGSDGKWYNPDETEFEITVKTFDKEGNEVKKVTVMGRELSDIVLDVDFDDRIISEADENGNITYAFDFDTLSKFLNSGLNNVIEKYVGSLNSGVVGTILGLVQKLNFIKIVTVNDTMYLGISVAGINIPLINQSTGKIDIDINSILTDFVKTMYDYQSAVIKPVWEFYQDPMAFEGSPEVEVQINYARYERALYTGTVQAKMIGSILIGDSLGTGAYDKSLGLTDLASVQQLKTDLSYQPVYFPLYALRDMLAFCTGIAILFYFLSFVAAQREQDYATGKLTVRSKKDKSDHEEQVIAQFNATDVANADETALSDTAIDLKDAQEEKDTQKKGFGKKKKADDELDNLTDDELALLGEDLEEEKPAKKRFGKKNKAIEEEVSIDGLTTDEFSEEEPSKKKRFGKKKQEDNDEMTSDEITLDDADVAEEKPTKKRFGKKDREATEVDDLDNMTEEELALLAGEDLEEDKPKKKLFGKPKKSKHGGDDEALTDVDGEEVL